MKISVIIIFYNQTKYVKRALQSVVRQTYLDLDIVVVDDGSDESIEDYVRGFANPRIRFFRTENRGPASARNLGIREARGEYIAFLDGDDVFFPKRIEMAVSVLRQKDWPICVVSCGAYTVNSRNHVLGTIKPHAYSVGSIIDTFSMLPSCSIYHAEIFNRLGGFPESLRTAEDGAFNAVVAQYYPVVPTPEKLVFYRMDDKGLARKKLNDFDGAVLPLRQMTTFIEEKINCGVADEYRKVMFTNLLFGFLSAGRMDHAVRWYREATAYLELNSFQGFLAKVSMLSGINLYSMVRRIRQFVMKSAFLPVSMRVKPFLLL